MRRVLFFRGLLLTLFLFFPEAFCCRNTRDTVALMDRYFLGVHSFVFVVFFS